MELHSAWARIVKEVPDASLVITSDWRLWADWCTEEQIRHFKLSYSRLPNVQYLGAVRRDDLVNIQMGASVHLYPSIFEEMFCIPVEPGEEGEIHMVTELLEALMAVPVEMEGLE